MAGNRSGTVRFLQSLEVPALDHAGVAFTLAGAGDVYLVSGGEHVRLYQVAYVVSVDVVEPELSESSLGGYVGFREVSGHRLLYLMGLQIAEADLHSRVAVVFNSLFLGNHTGAGFHDCYGNDFPVLIENLRHADFLADDSFLHVTFPPSRLLVGVCQLDRFRLVGWNLSLSR